MKRFYFFTFTLSMLVLLAPVLARSQGTYTAASCSYADVSACVNSGSANTCSPGGKHTVVNGDVVQVPAGTCTWTSQLLGPSGVNFQLLGTGTPNSGSSTTGPNASCANGTSGTYIIDNYTGGNMIEMRPSYNASYNAPSSRVSCMAIDPNSTSTALYDPILLTAACTSSGCPAIRVDNITFGLKTPWSENTNSSNAEAGILAVNVFGVLDHNSAGTSSNPSAGSAGFELFNSELGAYLGVGSFGDNSWQQPDSLGGANNLFAENNLDYNAGYLAMNDSEQDDQFTNRGGARVVLRYNTLHQGSGNNGGYGLFENHGTDSGGRARGAREQEVYNNTFYCAGSSTNCSGVDAGVRSGTGLFYGNTANFSVGSNGPWVHLSLYRNNVSSWTPFSPNCGGFNPWDTNDGATVSATFTISSTGSGVINASSATWTANQFAPVAGSSAYLFYDITASSNGSVVAAITGNTSTQLSIGAFTGGTPSAGDSFVIVGTRLYYAGTISTVSGSGETGNSGMTDTLANFGNLIPSGAPYSVFDPNGGWGGEIAANTATTITVQPYVGYGPYGFSVGDKYWVTRATVCVDQPTRGQQTSTEVSGDPISPVGAVTESLDPIYQWNDTAIGGSTSGNISSGSLRLIANRDFYSQASGIQTSSTSPFNGSSGTGWGTLANRPTSCTTGVGYAEYSGSTFVQLDKCTATNTWKNAAYTPYTYPHPLDGGTAVPPPVTPSPSTGLTWTVTPN